MFYFEALWKQNLEHLSTFNIKIIITSVSNYCNISKLSRACVPRTHCTPVFTPFSTHINTKLLEFINHCTCSDVQHYNSHHKLKIKSKLLHILWRLSRISRLNTPILQIMDWIDDYYRWVISRLSSIWLSLGITSALLEKSK